MAQPKAITPHSTAQRSLKLELATEQIKDDAANTCYEDDECIKVPDTQMSPVSQDSFESKLQIAQLLFFLQQQLVRESVFLIWGGDNQNGGEDLGVGSADLDVAVPESGDGT